MKKNIYMFWMGDINLFPHDIDELNKRYKKLNFILGPSSEDHHFLMKNFEYYNLAYKKKIYSFCSDVWRFYILSKNKGFYIDVNTKLGPNFENYVLESSKYDIFFIKGYSNDFGSNFMARWGNDTSFFEFVLERYKKRKNIFDIRLYHVGPTVATTSFISFFNYEIQGTEEQYFEKQNMFLDSFLNMYSKEIIFNYGSGSWQKNKAKATKNARLLREKLYKNWQSKKLINRKIEKRQIKKDQISPFLLRLVYDQSVSKEKNKILLKIYKKIPNKSFYELLIWSKLYRFFTFKWIKTK